MKRKVDVKNLKVRVSKGMAVILIKRSGEIIARRGTGKIDAQFERTVRLLTGVLHNRLHRYDGAGAYVERHFIQTRMKVDLGFTGVFLRRPVVEPFAGG